MSETVSNTVGEGKQSSQQIPPVAWAGNVDLEWDELEDPLTITTVLGEKDLDRLGAEYRETPH